VRKKRESKFASGNFRERIGFRSARLRGRDLQVAHLLYAEIRDLQNEIRGEKVLQILEADDSPEK